MTHGDAVRWRLAWARALDHFGHLAAEQLAEAELVSSVADQCTAGARFDAGALEGALRAARRFRRCKARFWTAFAREMSLTPIEDGGRLGDVDWFGEG